MEMRLTLNRENAGSNPAGITKILRKIMKKYNLCEYVGALSKILASHGLSWGYYCFKESSLAGNHNFGEGEFIFYYRGFDYAQHEHGRLSFVMEDDGSEDIFMIGSYGVQGPGEHYQLETIKFPTEEQIESAVAVAAAFLKERRIDVEH